MTDDELLLIYQGLPDISEAMKAQEIILNQKSAHLDAAVAQPQCHPLTLGKQTQPEYIAIGVRQSIQDDVTRPIARLTRVRLLS